MAYVVTVVVSPLTVSATVLRAVNAKQATATAVTVATQMLTRIRRSMTNRCGVQRLIIDSSFPCYGLLLRGYGLHCIG